MKTLLKRHRFTVNEYHRMGEAGILHEDDRIELIEGELIEMAAIGSPHFVAVNNFNELFVLQNGGRYIVSVQNPIRLSDRTEPLPDLVIFRRSPDRFAGGIPGPMDALLVVEVSDTTLSTDRRVKLPLYATAGIADAWILNLPRRVLEVHRDPVGGRYQQVTVYGSGESAAMLGFPDVVIAVDDVLPLITP